MGFLDRLVSDMIRRETGFNPRRLVRRVGGRNILLLGGAALAGGMLAQSKFQGQVTGQGQLGSPTGSSGGTTLPPTRSIQPGSTQPGSTQPGSTHQIASQPGPPPVPTPLPPLPPLPKTSSPPATQAASDGAETRLGKKSAELAEASEPPPKLLYAIVRTMVAAALADGELSAEEKTIIESRLAESTLSDAQIAQIRRDLVIPASVKELASLLPEGEDPEVLAEFGVLIARADGQRTEQETAWLRSLAEALKLPAHRIDVLTEEIFLPE